MEWNGGSKWNALATHSKHGLQPARKADTVRKVQRVKECFSREAQHCLEEQVESPTLSQQGTVPRLQGPFVTSGTECYGQTLREESQKTQGRADLVKNQVHHLQVPTEEISLLECWIKEGK